MREGSLITTYLFQCVVSTLQSSDFHRELHAFSLSSSNERFHSIASKVVEIKRNSCILEGKMTYDGSNNDLGTFLVSWEFFF